jgi:hypothetical protein
VRAASVPLAVAGRVETGIRNPTGVTGTKSGRSAEAMPTVGESEGLFPGLETVQADPHGQGQAVLQGNRVPVTVSVPIPRLAASHGGGGKETVMPGAAGPGVTAARVTG